MARRRSCGAPYVQRISRGFVLTHEQDKRLEKRLVGFESVRSVKPVGCVKPGHTTRNILIGVGIGLGAVAAIAGIGVALAEK